MLATNKNFVTFFCNLQKWYTTFRTKHINQNTTGVICTHMVDLAGLFAIKTDSKHLSTNCNASLRWMFPIYSNVKQQCLASATT